MIRSTAESGSKEISMKWAHALFLLVSVCLFSFVFYGYSFAGMSKDVYRSPYGLCCPGSGNCYGVQKGLMTQRQVYDFIKDYYRRENLRIGAIRPVGPWFFMVDIFKGDKQIDRVLIDRRTGRIRTTY